MPNNRVRYVGSTYPFIPRNTPGVVRRDEDGSLWFQADGAGGWAEVTPDELRAIRQRPRLVAALLALIRR